MNEAPKERTEKEILDKIEDYTRATMKNSKATATNTAVIMWLMLLCAFGALASILLSMR